MASRVDRTQSHGLDGLAEMIRPRCELVGCAISPEWFVDGVKSKKCVCLCWGGGRADGEKSKMNSVVCGLGMFQFVRVGMVCMCSALSTSATFRFRVTSRDSLIQVEEIYFLHVVFNVGPCLLHSPCSGCSLFFNPRSCGQVSVDTS